MRKQLTKSNNVVLTGTLAGIAEWIGVDPTIVRVLYVIIGFFSAGFPGVLLYIALAVLIPSGRNYNQYGHKNTYNRNTRNANPYANEHKKQRKQAEKVDNDDWSDF